ncbi:hypothetical protein QBC38DRAFT_512024 [Podospora fimiseda]|uniref:Uncharacterized protein n=1 Tax=Podospora fimiseda TaxID=252190 RepID=A0AAN7GWB0_9PEZI|nr:hypothetical protein QBC38DRAFT_512024 [Podospora fimiseda]
MAIQSVEENTDGFSKKVVRLRSEYSKRRQKSNAFPPAWRSIHDTRLVRGEKPAVEIWYKDGRRLGQYARLDDIPGTFSGAILRIEGDVIRKLDEAPEHPPEEEDDCENVSDLVAKLPAVDVDPSKYFTKKGKYRSEIEKLLKCQGGSCPGTVLSPHLIHLLGASSDEQLVFERFSTRVILGHFSSLESSLLSPLPRHRTPRCPDR